MWEKLVGLYTPSDSSWYWKKMCRVKEVFKTGCDLNNPWRWQGGKDYTVRKGYDWQFQNIVKVKWDKLVWARMTIPRHYFIMWIFVHHRMPTKVRLSKFHPHDSLRCVLCNSMEEDEHHLFIGCPSVQSLWKGVREWWPLPPIQSTIEGTIKAMLKTRGDKYLR